MALCVLAVGCFVSPVPAAVLLGVVAASSQRGAPLWWQVVSFMALALLPGQIWGVMAAVLVMFWPWLNRKPDHALAAIAYDKSAAPCVAVVAALLVWHGAASGPVEAVLFCCAMTLVLAVKTAQGAEAEFAAAGMMRPALLAALAGAARHEGLDTAEHTAVVAAILDAVVQFLRAWPARYVPVTRILAVPFPPLPGFVVLWLGVHAAFNVASGAVGWAVPAMITAFLLGGLAVLELWHSSRVAAAPVVVSLRNVMQAVVLIAGMVLGIFLVQKYAFGGESSVFFALSGGDGAFLRLGSVFIFLGIFLWVTVRREGGRAVLGQGLVLPPGGLISVQRYTLPWVWRRYRMVVRQALRDMRGLSMRHNARLARMTPLLREGGASLGWWLAVLALVLAVLGAQA